MEPAALVHFITEPTRHQLLSFLQEGERSVTEMVQACGGEQSNISHHLRSLREAGLVRARRDGRTRRYRLTDPEVGRLLAELEDAARRLDRTAFFAGLEIPLDPAFHGYG